MSLVNSLDNNLSNKQLDNNLEIGKEQNNFLQSTLVKVINTGLDIGLRMLLPDMIENQIIDIKNTMISQGFSQGIKKAISSAIDFGKSTAGIITGNFENISQAQLAIQNGGIIDGISNAIDFALNKSKENNLLPNTITNTIRTGKNSLLNTISNNIENEFYSQLESVERLSKYSNNWKNYFKNKDFEGMTKELYKINNELKTLMPMENTINEARTIKNLHNLIKNNGKSFNLTEEQLELAKMLK